MNVGVVQAIELQVARLYRTAAARHSCYETLVHREFCVLMIQAFPDETTSDAEQAFKHARAAYGYLSPSELDEQDIKNGEEGICTHGLDFWTCPCGCFEND